MTQDDRNGDQPQGPPPEQRPPTRPEVPSWVDEVLSAQSSAPVRPQTSREPDPAPPPTPEITVVSVDPAAVARPSSGPASASGPASGSGDLRIPEAAQARPAVAPLTPPDQTAASQTALQSAPQSAPQPAPQPASPAAPTLLDSADDWIARATGGTARSPSAPPLSPFQTDSVTQAPVPARQPDPWAMGNFAAAPAPGDIATKRLIAGLLGIVLGSFGVHKLFLGITTPGLIMLAVNVGVWIVALLLGLLTLGIGLIVTLPLAGLVSGALALLGLIEGILYLTKSDADFYQQYVVEKKPWL